MGEQPGRQIVKAAPNGFDRHSKVRILIHFAWSTEGRMPWITPDIESRLHAYMTEICRRKGCYVVAIGGVEDHVHLLLYLGHEIAVSDLVKNVKGSSSRFATAELGLPAFQWQRGYAAFGVSPQDKTRIVAYVRDQKRHHADHELWAPAEILPDNAP